MASIAQVRAGIQAVIENAIPDLTVYRTVEEVAHPPAVVIALAADDTCDFTGAMARGMDTWQYDLYVLTLYTDAEIGQDDLDLLIDGAGARSIRQAIYNNRSLGLTRTDAHVARVSQYGSSFESADLQHIGAVLRLIVHTRGDE